MGTYSTYDIGDGLLLVTVPFMVVTFIVFILMTVHVYRCLQAQDAALVEGVSTDIRADVLAVLKKIVLWIFGYRGEDRERVPVTEVSLDWVSRYKISIFFRLLPVYTAYILILVVLTRPVFMGSTGYEIFRYSENLHELFAFLAIYVISNILFDYFSLRYTFVHILKAQETGKYLFYLIKDIAVAMVLFIGSQAISCVLWVLKRQDTGFPQFNYGLFSQFVEITLWPYAFVSGQGSALIVSDLFPGQLLITGTVFFPTAMLSVIFLVLVLFLVIVRMIKSFLISRQLDRICRLFLKVHLFGMFNPKAIGNQFRYCNYAFMAFLNISFLKLLDVIVDRAFGG